MGKSFTLAEAKGVGNRIGVNWTKYNLEQFRIGLGVELEHGMINPATNVTNDNLEITGKIALAHLNEFPDYYERLEKMENKQNKPTGHTCIHYAIDTSIDSIVDPPFTETYQCGYNENRREDNKLMLDD
ncbi:MAG TPA: DUF5661 family protein [Ignavibacteria bacterium]|jgi:DNA-directed RNA polymerase alpha subunit